MIATTLNGKSVYLLPYLPDFDAKLSASFKVIGEMETALTAHEEREAMGTPRVSKFSFNTLLNLAEKSALRAALDSYDNRPVLVPFWPSVKLLSETTKTPAIVGAVKLWIELKDASKWEIGTGSAPGGFVPSAYCMEVPLMWAAFDKLPKIKAVNGLGDATVQVTVFENGDYDVGLRPASCVLTTQTVAGQVVPVLTVPCSWGNHLGQHETLVKREQIGFGRKISEVYFPQIPRENWDLSFEAMRTPEINYLLALFWDRGGKAGPWLVPSVHDTYTKKLGRFESDTLSIEWQAPLMGGSETAKASLSAITLPLEEVVQQGETLGLTLGGKPTRWFGYVVTDGDNTWRFTSYERSIAGPGGTFEPKPMTHGKIREEINLAVDDCDVTFESWVGCPFTRLLTQRNAAPLKMKIYEGYLSEPLNARLIYTGECVIPSSDNNRKWTMKVKGPSAIGSIKGPRQSEAASCSARIGDARCKLNLDSLASTQTLTSWTGSSVLFSTGSATIYADGHFALGYAERTIGGVKQRYMIIDSKQESGNQRLTLECAIAPAPSAAEAGWKLFPGCDGSATRCKALNNWPNHRGRPFVPNANPSITPVKETAGGKK